MIQLGKLTASPWRDGRLPNPCARKVAYIADFARRAIRHGLVSIGKLAVALVTEGGRKVWSYLVVWGNYDLHGDNGARLNWYSFLNRKSLATSKFTLGRLAAQGHGNAIPTEDNLLELSVTHQTKGPEAYEIRVAVRLQKNILKQGIGKRYMDPMWIDLNIEPGKRTND